MLVSELVQLTRLELQGLGLVLTPGQDSVLALELELSSGVQVLLEGEYRMLELELGRR